MTARTLIVDDEAPARRRLRNLLASRPDCDIVGEAESGATAVELISQLQPDLLLLDIQLKDMTGFEVLKKTRDLFPGVVIFITAYDEFAIKAFEAKAIDYLLKPFKNQRFHESLEHAIQTIEKGKSTSFDELLDLVEKKMSRDGLVKIQEGKVSHHIHSGELIYVQSDASYCHFHSKSDVKMIRISLKETERQLPSNFVRINRSVIINTSKISSTKQHKNSVQIILTNGDEFTAFHNLDALL